jgi:hypothetical protein
MRRSSLAPSTASQASATASWSLERVLAGATWRADAAALTLITGVIAAVYMLVDAPLYNPLGTVDAWLYTALFANFDFTYKHFWDTYYASRLPWVLPGVFLHDVFSSHVAYFVLHGAFFLGGGVALFVLVRRFLGRLPAFVAYSALLANQLYYNAHAWDYIDGAIVTYLLAAFACGVTTVMGLRRVLALFAGGFFLAAAIATNIFVIAFAVGFPLLYIAVNPVRGHIRRLLEDAIAFTAGMGSLLLAGAIFAWTHGANLFFLAPQIHAAQVIEGGAFRATGYEWVVQSPRLIAPLFLLVVGAVVLPRAPRRDPAERRRWQFAIGAYVYLLLAETFLVVYELAGSAVLEYPYYASLLLPAMGIATAAIVYAASTGARVGSRWVLLAIAGGASLLPLLLVYLRDTRDLVGSTGTWITVAVVGLVFAALLMILTGWLPATARVATMIVAVTLMVFGVNFSVASSDDVYDYAVSNPENGNVYDVGMEFITYMRENGFQRKMPYFWYNAADGPELSELQSLYYFSYSSLGFGMPKIDRDFLSRERLYRPRTIVLLCQRLECRGGPGTLRAHGYRLSEAGRRRFVSGRFAVWVRVFRVDQAPAPT